MRRRLLFVMTGSALLIAASGAWGATAIFNVSATCMANCDAAGINQGNSVDGRVEIATDGFAPSGAITRDDLVNFDITFGNTPTGVFMVLSPGYGFAATWGASVSAIDGVSFTASGAAALGLTGPFLSFGPGGNVVSLGGICRDAGCATTSIEGAPTTLGPVTFQP